MTLTLTITVNDRTWKEQQTVAPMLPGQKTWQFRPFGYRFDPVTLEVLNDDGDKVVGHFTY